MVSETLEHSPTSPPDVTGPRVRVLAKTDIFSADRIDASLHSGGCIVDLIEEAGVLPRRGFETAVYLNDQRAALETWHVVRPKAGDTLTVVQVPQLGGDTNSGLRIAATIAVIAAAAAIAPPVSAALGGGALGAAGGAVAAAAVATGGTLAVNALIPPPGTEGADEEDDASSVVTGQTNRLAPYEPIPVVKGFVQVFPRHFARPYTEIAGNDVIARLLLTPGVGPLDISEIKVGDTPIESFPSSELEFEVREGTGGEPDLTLFTRDINEVNPNTQLRRDTGPTVIQTAADTTEISLDFTWPQGIYDQRKDGKRDRYATEYQLEIRPSAGGPWLPFFASGDDDFVEVRETSRVIRRNFRRGNLAPDTWDVRITRRTGDSDPPDTNNVSQAFLTAFRSIKSSTDVTPTDDIALIAIKVKRDGPIGVISCLAKSIVLDWNGAAWVSAISNNPASLYRSVLQDNAIPIQVPDADIRLDLLEAWHDTNVTEGWAFNGVFEDKSQSVLDVLRLIAFAGRAKPSLPNGKYGVIQDVLQTTPVALITPHNSSGLQIRKSWAPPPLALRVQFRNEDTEFQTDEVLVFDDGQTEGNTPTDRIELLDLIKAGITDSDLAWRHGRFYIANAKLRPEVFTTTQGLDALILDCGDYARLQHDVIQIRRGSARITGLTLDGSSNVTAIQINNKLEMETATSYAIEIRSIVGGSDQLPTVPIDTVVGLQDELTPTTPIPAATAPAVGDLLAFGVAGVVTEDVLVTDVIGQPGLSAQIVMTQLAPAVYTADTGPIPPFTSNIVLPGNFFAKPPATPEIQDVSIEEIALQSAPDVVHQVQIAVTLRQPSSNLPAAIQYQMRLRELGDDTWAIRQEFPGDSLTLLVAPQNVGLTYELQVRAIGLQSTGRTNESTWTATTTVNVPLPETTVTDIYQVAGLELIGQRNDVEFVGKNPSFQWRVTSNRGAVRFGTDGSGISFPDPGFGVFKIRIIDPATGQERREETSNTASYTYDYERNFDDGRRLGTGALRNFEFRVAVIDNFQREGPGQKLIVTNPAPATPAGLQVINGVSSVTIQADLPTDPDFEGMIVWGSTISGFSPSESNELARAKQSILTIQADPGVPLYLRVAFFDAFGSDVGSLNISSELLAQPIDVSAVPDFTFNDIEFQPNSPSQNDVSWTAGSVVTFFNGVTTTTSISAGQATYPGSDILYLYYVKDSTIISSTSDASQATGTNNRIVATYRGDTLLRTGNGDVFTDGSLLIAGTVLGQAIKAGDITGDKLAADSLIVNSAQIGTAVVDTLQLKNGSVTNTATDVVTTSKSVTTEEVELPLTDADFQSNGGNVLILCTFEYAINQVTNDTRVVLFYRVRRDGTLLQNVRFLDESVRDTTRSITIMEIDVPTQDTHNYEVSVIIDSATADINSLSITSDTIRLLLFEAKR